MANLLDIKGLMSEAIIRLAKKYSTSDNELTPQDIAVKIFMNPETQNLGFRLFVKWQPVVVDRIGGLLSFNRDILNVSVDLMNREVILNKMIMPPILQRLSEEVSADSPYDIFIFVGMGDSEPALFLYHKNVEVRELSVEKDF